MDLENDNSNKIDRITNQNTSRKRLLSVEIENNSKTSKNSSLKSMNLSKSLGEYARFDLNNNTMNSPEKSELFLEPEIQTVLTISPNSNNKKNIEKHKLSVIVSPFSELKQSNETSLSIPLTMSSHVSSSDTSHILNTKKQALEVYINDSLLANDYMDQNSINYSLSPSKKDNLKYNLDSTGIISPIDATNEPISKTIPENDTIKFTSSETIDEVYKNKENLNFTEKTYENIVDELMNSQATISTNEKINSLKFIAQDLEIPEFFDITNTDTITVTQSLGFTESINSSMHLQTQNENRNNLIVDPTSASYVNADFPSNGSSPNNQVSNIHINPSSNQIIEISKTKEDISLSPITNTDQPIITPRKRGRKKGWSKAQAEAAKANSQDVIDLDPNIQKTPVKDSTSCLFSKVSSSRITRNKTPIDFNSKRKLAETTCNSSNNRSSSALLESNVLSLRKKKHIVSYKYTLKGAYDSMNSPSSLKHSPTSISSTRSRGQLRQSNLSNISDSNIQTSKDSSNNTPKKLKKNGSIINSTSSNFSLDYSKVNKNSQANSKKAKKIEKPREERDWQEFYPDLSLDKKIKVINIANSSQAIIHKNISEIAPTPLSKSSKKRSFIEKDYGILESAHTLSVKKPMDLLPRSEFEILNNELPKKFYLRSDMHHVHYSGEIEINNIDTIEYDLDDVDYRWLQLVNKNAPDERARIGESLLEKMIYLLEIEWYILTRNTVSQITQKKLPVLSSDDAACNICEEEECDNSNAIVFCDGCNLAVHQDCYGVPYIPEGQWLCRRCMLCPDKNIKCIFCPQKGGAFKKTSDNSWAHLLCALWIPEVGISNTVYMEPIDSVENIPKSRWKLVCTFCGIKCGACIQCANKSCFTAFHVTCARKARIYMKMKPDLNTKDPIFRAYCKRHTPRNHDKILDIEAPLRVLQEAENTKNTHASIELNSSKTLTEKNPNNDNTLPGGSLNIIVKKKGRGRPRKHPLVITTNTINAPTSINPGTGSDTTHKLINLPSSPSTFSSPARKKLDFESIDLSATENANKNSEPILTSSSSKSLTSTLLIFNPERPVINNYIFNKVFERLRKTRCFFNYFKLKNYWQDMLKLVCKYWALKRSVRNGVPLLKKLYLEPWSHPLLNTHSDKPSEDEKNKLHLIRNDLCKLRDVLKSVLLREKLKMKIAKSTAQLASQIFYPLKESYLDTLRYFLSVDKLNIFSSKVTDDIAPLYSTIIKNPMDLSTIWKKVNSFSYLTIKDFEYDLRLVWNNCMDYNTPKSTFYRMAKNFNKLTGSLITSIQENCKMLNISDKEYEYLPLGSGSNVGILDLDDLPPDSLITEISIKQKEYEDQLDTISKNILDFRIASTWKAMILDSLSGCTNQISSIPNRGDMAKQAFLALNSKSNSLNVNNSSSPQKTSKKANIDVKNVNISKFLTHSSSQNAGKLNGHTKVSNSILIPVDGLSKPQEAITDSSIISESGYLDKNNKNPLGPNIEQSNLNLNQVIPLNQSPTFQPSNESQDALLTSSLEIEVLNKSHETSPNPALVTKVINEPQEASETPREFVLESNEIDEDICEIAVESNGIDIEPACTLGDPNGSLEEPSQIVEETKINTDELNEVVENSNENVEEPKEIDIETCEIIDDPNENIENLKEIHENQNECKVVSINIQEIFIDLSGTKEPSLDLSPHGKSKNLHKLLHTSIDETLDFSDSKIAQETPLGPRPNIDRLIDLSLPINEKNSNVVSSNSLVKDHKDQTSDVLDSFTSKDSNCLSSESLSIMNKNPEIHLYNFREDSSEDNLEYSTEYSSVPRFAEAITKNMIKSRLLNKMASENGTNAKAIVPKPQKKSKAGLRELKSIFSTPAVLTKKEKLDVNNLINSEDDRSRYLKENIINLINSKSSPELIEETLDTFVKSKSTDPSTENQTAFGRRMLRPRSSCQSISSQSSSIQSNISSSTSLSICSDSKQFSKKSSPILNNSPSSDPIFSSKLRRRSSSQHNESGLQKIRPKRKSSFNFEYDPLNGNERRRVKSKIGNSAYSNNLGVILECDLETEVDLEQEFELSENGLSPHTKYSLMYQPKARRVDGKLKIPFNSPAIFNTHYSEWKIGYPVWAAMTSFPWFPAEIYDSSLPGIPQAVNDDRKDPERNCVLVHFYDITLPHRTWKWLAPYRLLKLGVDAEVDKMLLLAAEKRSKTAKEQVRAAYEYACKEHNLPFAT
ncbi:Peregrin [Smittium culicis]|uniref:Peregrin n=1 Tax=Smittium culicis TaxID=133412 RepID=A0A1R1YCL5_9FUNG|nr:Peregrin [Smittium culicis]